MTDIQSLISGLLGQADPAMAAVTPRLTKTSRDLPKQVRGKRNDALKELPADPAEMDLSAIIGDPKIEALITAALGDPSMAQMGAPEMAAELGREESGQPYEPDMDYLMELLTGQGGMGITPEMVAPKTTGTPHPANFNPESIMAKLLASMGVGPDPETPGDKTPYVDDEDPGDHEYR